MHVAKKQAKKVDRPRNTSILGSSGNATANYVSDVSAKEGSDDGWENFCRGALNSFAPRVQLIKYLKEKRYHYWLIQWCWPCFW